MLVVYFGISPRVSACAASLQGDITIIVLGDSLSAGYGFALEKAWPSLLENRIREAGIAAKVINASISGDTTKGGASRIDRLLKRHKAELVIIELGANDGLRGIPAQHAERNLKMIIEKVKASGACPLLFEMKIPPNYGAEFERQYHQLYENLAQIDQVTVVPFFLIDVIFKPNLMQADGLHPTATAQPVILDYVWPYIEDKLGANMPTPAEKKSSAETGDWLDEILQ